MSSTNNNDTDSGKALNRGVRGNRRRFTDEQEQEIAQRYLVKEESTTQLGKVYGVGPTTVRDILQRQGVDLRPKVGRALTAEQEQEVARRYLVKEESTHQLGRAYGVSKNAINRILERLGIDRRPKVERALTAEQEQEIAQRYLAEEGNAYQLGKVYGVNPTTIYDILERLGIDRRQPTNPTTRRTANIEALRQVLLDLDAEGVAVARLNQAQHILIAQQAGLSKAALGEGLELFRRIASGKIPPAWLAEWSKGKEPEPPSIQPVTPTMVTPAAPPPATRPAAPAPAVVPPAMPGPEPLQLPLLPPTVRPEPAPGGDIPPPPPLPPELGGATEPGLPDLPEIDAESELRFIDADIFVAADEEAVSALVAMQLARLWDGVYRGGENAMKVVETCRHFKGRGPWTARVQAEFLRQYEAAVTMKLPVRYRFTIDGQLAEPTLMQRRVAAQAVERRRLLVLSDMGLGKSLAAQLAVMAADRRRILVLPVNECVHQWARDFREHWSGVDVRYCEGTTLALPDPPADGRPQVLVISLHLFTYMDDAQVAELAGGFNPDAVILDEIQFVKQRAKDEQSRRREQAAKLLSVAAANDPDLMVLGLSGTVIVNNLREGRKQIELVTLQERPDLDGDRNDAAAAMRLHQALMANGIRQRSDNNFRYEVMRPAIDASAFIDEVKAAIHAQPRAYVAAIEKALLQAKLPSILAAIDGPTVIATHYVEGIVHPLRRALEAVGYTVGIHTGDTKGRGFACHGEADALEAFKAGRLDILIAGIDVAGTGVDGLQRVAHTLVVATLPWTYAKYIQLIRRLARMGQKKTVRVVIPTTYIDYIDPESGPTTWSFCRYRADVIEQKRRLMAASVDGILPDDDAVSEAQAGRDLRAWIERLSEESVVVRADRPLRVPLDFATPSEELAARRRYGDWSSCMGRWNGMSGAALHRRLQANPTEWELFHTDLAARRLGWAVDPLEETIRFCAERKGMVIGDFGCGTAQLAEAMQGRNKVRSFDHLAYNDRVTPCDIAAGVPLAEEVLDLVVSCLALMGTDWREHLVEAWRVLKPTGQLLVWTAAGNRDIDELVAVVARAGFQVIEAQHHERWFRVWAVRTPLASVSIQRQQGVAA